MKIGPSPGNVAFALRFAVVEVLTPGVEPSDTPAMLRCVTDIPPDGDACDVIVCQRIIEGLPFEQSVLALTELRRVASTGCVTSLPDTTPGYCIQDNHPLLHRRSFAICSTRLNLPIEVPENRYGRDGHLLEIGAKKPIQGGSRGDL